MTKGAAVGDRGRGGPRQDGGRRLVEAIGSSAAEPEVSWCFDFSFSDFCVRGTCHKTERGEFPIYAFEGEERFYYFILFLAKF